MKHTLLSIFSLMLLFSAGAQDTVISQTDLGMNWYSGNTAPGGQSFTLHEPISLTKIRFSTLNPEGYSIFEVREGQDLNGNLLYSDTFNFGMGWIDVDLPGIDVCPGVYCFTISEFEYGAMNLNNPYPEGGCFYVSGWGQQDMAFEIIGNDYDPAPVALSDTLLPFTGVCSVTDFTVPQASDCNLVIDGVPDQPLEDLGTGTHVVTWTYTDAGGNTVSQQQQFNIAPLVSTASIGDYLLSAGVENAGYQWVDCNNGNAVISGETGQSMTITEATGSYAVITTLNSCSDTSECLAFDFVSLKENETLSFTVYPNPNNGVFHVTLENVSAAEYRVLDVSGRIVDAGNVNNGDIKLQNALSGVYFLELTSENKALGTARIFVK